MTAAAHAATHAPLSFKIHTSDKVLSSSARKRIFRRGGVVVNLDTNWSRGGQTSPMVVIPDNATAEQRSAAHEYATRIAEVYERELGSSLPPRVVTRNQNGRGRTATIHTEPFAVTDSKAVEYFSSDDGLKEHAAILRDTLGQIQNVEISIPHNPSRGDYGAHGTGTNEVKLARALISVVRADLPPVPRDSPEVIKHHMANSSKAKAAQCGQVISGTVLGAGLSYEGAKYALGEANQIVAMINTLVNQIGWVIIPAVAGAAWAIFGWMRNKQKEDIKEGRYESSVSVEEA